MTFKISDEMAAHLKLCRNSPELKAMEAEANRQIEQIRLNAKNSFKDITIIAPPHHEGNKTMSCGR